MIAETPCKLLRFLVSDGAHVETDTPYAEVEVMKMCMPLLLPASGVIHFVMSEGQAMQVNCLTENCSLFIIILDPSQSDQHNLLFRLVTS